MGSINRKSKHCFQEAVKLRKKGYSLKEVSEKVNISKSTASLWLRGTVISEEARERLDSLSEEGLKRSKETKRRIKKDHLKRIAQECNVLQEGEKISKDQYKLLLAFLHWTEGSSGERRLVFTNSDPEMIKSYLFLLRKSYNIKDSKFRVVLHLHDYHDVENQIKFWSKITRIDRNNFSIYHKKNTSKRRRLNYQGCIQIRYGDVKILDELDLIINRFIKFINAGVG